MATLKDRAPFLFETQKKDADGRPMDDPKQPGHILSAGPRVPSPAEVVAFVMSAHHIVPDMPAAIDIVNSLDELAKMSKPATPAPPTPSAPQPAPANPPKA